MAAVGRTHRSGQVTVRASENSAIDPEAKPEDGKVENVVKKWLVYEDRVIADRIQSEEIEQHYNKNRINRRTVREDIPLAKEVYSQEEAKAQYERMKQLEEQKRIAEQDANLAKQLQAKLTDEQREDLRRKQLHDQVVSNHLRHVRHHYQQHNGDPVDQDYLQGQPQEFARHMQEREARMRYDPHQSVGSPPRTSHYAEPVERRPSGDQWRNDYQHLSEAVGGPTLASLQTPTLTSQSSFPDEEFDEEALEAEDRELAVRLQRQEEERYERKKQQRLLAKERKRLEKLIHQSQQQEQAAAAYPSRAHQPPEDGDGDFSDFYVPPDPNMSPEQSRLLQEEQDAELARLMQDQEKRRTHSDMLRDKLKQIESQDLELAKIIQEEENLRAKRRTLKHQQKILQQQNGGNVVPKREVAERIASQNSPNQTLSSTASNEPPYPGGRVNGRQESRYSNNSSTERQGGAVQQPPTTSQHGNTRLDSNPALAIRQTDSRSASNNPYNSRIPSDVLPSNRTNNALPSNHSSAVRLPGNHASADPLPSNHSSAARLPSNHFSADRLPSSRSDEPGRVPTEAVSQHHVHQDSESADWSPDRLYSGRIPDAAKKPPEASGGRLPRTNLSAGGRQVKLPIDLPNRMIQNTDLRAGAQQGAGLGAHQGAGHGGHQVVGSYGVTSDMSNSQASSNRSAGPRRDMYAEKPSAGRGGYSPSRNSRDVSPPGPALPERRYRDDMQPPAMHSQDRPHVHIGLPEQHGPPGRQDGRSQDIPPYRGLHPPPYHNNPHRSQESSEGAPSSPRSAETHYDTPWDMSQLESQLLRDASVNQQAQPIKPRHVSPPGRRGEAPAHHRSPQHVQGPGGRPLIEQNEDGQIVMNIAEMLDPTYSRRQGQRSSMHESHNSHGYEVPATSEGEITAIAGQRRHGRKQSSKRESCKQQ